MHHEPVMLQEILEMLSEHLSYRVHVDATLGAAGHARAVLDRYPGVQLIGFDQDFQARTIANEVLSPFKERFKIIAGNFSELLTLKDQTDWKGADALLFDLGVSNMQLTFADRGFSFNEEGPLDMRMNQDFSSEAVTAQDILDTYSIAELTKIFKDYGEEKHAYYIARGIVRHREQGKTLATTSELVDLIRFILPAPVQRKMGGHPARRIFQALRIEVNDEMGALTKALQAVPLIVNPGARVLVLSYHSLEDRIIKHCFRDWRINKLGREINKKALLPSLDEIEANRKARSAKLRGFEFYKVSDLKTEKERDQ